MTDGMSVSKDPLEKLFNPLSTLSFGCKSPGSTLKETGRHDIPIVIAGRISSETLGCT